MNGVRRSGDDHTHDINILPAMQYASALVASCMFEDGGVYAL